uniref:C2H2-type domain-containing protein n=1 Tax=Timema tahoe TaxID=61484 RepID=A0A7R9FHN1_9NEOP|nr:unnamed protein product [Timema tahoe]
MESCDKELYPEDPLPKTVCIDCCAKLNQYFDFFESSSRAQLSLQLMFDPKENKNEMKKELDQEPTEQATARVEGEDSPSGLVVPRQGLVVPRQGLVVPRQDLVVPRQGLVVPRQGLVVPRQELNSSASSRRKRRVPMKRAPPTRKERATRQRADKKERKECEEEPLNVVKEEVKEEPTPASKADFEDNFLFGDDVGAGIEDSSEEDAEEEEEEEEDQSFDPKKKQVSGAANERKKKRKKGLGKMCSSKLPRTKSVLEGYPWQCTDCTSILPTLQELRTHHQVKHSQLPNFKCVQCAKVYTRYRSFARHVKLHRNPKKFRCEECGKCFSQKTVLQSHSTVHTDARPHVCPQCGKAFKQFSSLYLHSKCHLPDQTKPKFPCGVCQKEFATKHTLETHRKIHTGERNFICDVCGKSFIAKGSLDYHILTHSGEKPHHCPVCGKGFKTARLLGKHATLHTGIKPHQCDVCGKQFRERGALREHNRIHTGAMPYTCEFCGKNFRFKGILTVHRRQHTGERPYGCTDCRREFTNWANYNKHMKRRHRNDNDPSAPTRSANTRTYHPPAASIAANTAPVVYSNLTGGAGDNSNSSTLTQNSGMYSLQNNHSNLTSAVAKMAAANLYNQHLASNKMAAVFQHGAGANHASKMANVFHQQDSQDSLDRSNHSSTGGNVASNPLMGSYHVPSYVPAGLPMGSMGYYIPPIHHSDPSMDMLQHRMANNQ